ncbi:helix-turn-helix domain-containing protein [Halomonas sp. PR-M31]|uniref:helix-turn-helix domain-containing protein n=1 Tax=Halomonas sp. PR-M31 TaxID=1471202 RepID=UPI000650B92A|nr:helix-turn-helix domain-containing protein [Halomonas sp. PR-M31]
MKITSTDMLALSLKEARKHYKLTQQTVAEQAGIKQATVSGFENYPEKSRIETLFKLLAALDMELHVTERDQVRRDQGWDQEW